MKQDLGAVCTSSAELYDAVGALWLHLFGEHVHVGKILLDGSSRQVPAMSTHFEGDRGCCNSCRLLS